LIIIGAGSAGRIAADVAGSLRAKAAVIEPRGPTESAMNTRCIPSKALIHTTRLLALSRRAPDLGISGLDPRIDFQRVMRRVCQVSRTAESRDGEALKFASSVESIAGLAELESPYSVIVDGRRLTSRSILIATGSRPLIPDLPGLDRVDYLTSDTVWDLQELPRRLLILGGGAVGCELAQCFARLGAEVTIIEQRPQLLPQEDSNACALLHQQMRNDGIVLQLGMQAREVRIEGDRKTVAYSAADGSGPAALIEFDRLLVAAGRRPNVEGLGLDKLRIPLNPSATIQVNEYLQTNYPHIYACGDVAGPYQYTHLAMQQAWCATVNALYGFRRLKIDYAVVPWSTFTDPEIARVGLNESEARAQSVPYEATCIDFARLDRALADQQAPGLVKVLTVPERDKILGVTIVGPHASELIAEFVLAMNHGLGLRKILTTMHVYPTFTEIGRLAADAWQKDHFSNRTLAWLERLHRWRRA
jgi:pyruvate/2-oxoglutarate dehydrogenase complex dihydrolipoamide dehydrogenase (E3) component